MIQASGNRVENKSEDEVPCHACGSLVYSSGAGELKSFFAIDILDCFAMFCVFIPQLDIFKIGCMDCRCCGEIHTR